jgi:cell division protein FtsB
LEKQIEDLRVENENLQATNDQLRDNEESYEQQIEWLRHLEGQLRSDITVLETQNDDLQATNDELQEKVEEMCKTENFPDEQPENVST